MASSSVEITPATAESRTAALDCLFQHMEPADRSHFVRGLLSGTNDDPATFDGLLEARRDGELVGAIWAQSMPGQIGVIWPPALVPAEEESLRDDLIATALDYLNSQSLTMVQVLAEVDDKVQANSLQRAGFTHLADLLYLMSLDSAFPTSPPETPLTLDPVSDIADRRLQNVVWQTYTETMDCPELTGMRRLEDVLVGYRATGDPDAARWWIVAENQQDVGCLLMADHPETKHRELVYMGLVPSARGGGRGLHLVRHAQWETRRAGRHRLVLAVDANNSPAISMYDKADFFLWDAKRVFWRRFST